MIKEDVIILSTLGCPACETLKEKVGSQIPFYDIQEPNIMKLAKENNILTVPQAIQKDDSGWSKCKMFYRGNKVIIECPKKRLEL